MGAWIKVVKCMKCNKDMQIKSFRKTPGKHVFGKGYICEECLKKQEAPKAGNKQTPKKPAKATAK